MESNPGRDQGLRRMLTWTAIALVLSVLIAALAAGLAILFFDRG